MPRNLPVLSIFIFLALYSSSLNCSAQNTVVLSAYDAEYASGYVDYKDKTFSGDLKEIGSEAYNNSGFVVFNLSSLPAGTTLVSVDIELYVLSSSTYISQSGYARVTGIPVNPTNGGKTTQKEISTAPVYADDLDWGSASIAGAVVSSFSAEGIAAVQKKIGTAFSIGIDPPVSTGNYRNIAGYNTSATGAFPPRLRVAYTTATATKPNSDFTAGVRDTFVNGEVNFFDNSGNYPTSWLWDFGDSATAAERNPVHVYADTGYYTVTLTAGNAQGEDVMTKQRFIHVGPIPPPPVANFRSNKRNVAEDENVFFADLSTGYITKREWLFGDDESSFEETPLHPYANTGVYDVTLIASNAFGADTIVKKDFINVGGEVLKPVAGFSYAAQALLVSFSDGSANFPEEWIWDFGDGSDPGLVQNPVHQYKAEGAYKVCLEATNTAGTDTLCRFIPVDISGTGISQPGSVLNEWKIYPNPFAENLFVELPEKTPALTVEVYNALGKFIMGKKIEARKGLLNLSNVSPGLYVLLIRAEEEVKRKNIIKN